MSSAPGPQWPDQSGWPGTGGQDGPGRPPDTIAPPPAAPGPPPAPASPQFQQLYGQPAAWPPVVSPRGTNSLAIAALCCGIGQLAVGPLSGIPAIVLGAVSLRQIRETGEDGHGMAVAGVVLGVIGLVLSVLLIAIIVVIARDVVSSQSPAR